MKTPLSRLLSVCGSLLVLCLKSPLVSGAVPAGVAEGSELNDSRLGDLVDLNGYFPFQLPESTAEWQVRAQEVREQILVSQGLWPLPEKTPLNPVIHGRVSFGDYSVEKVFFESFPGFYVTGNLYRPIGKSGPRPGILCPHGHWANGRFMDNSDIRSEIASGAERFENGGRSVLQSRCVQLARMGCVVFHYDMIGYADSVQISYELAHRFAKQRPEMNRSTNWGLFSPQAESHLQSVMGLQTWNSIRSLDFLETLPEVDRSRLAVTGASGGGTQTFILGAIDSRPAVAFPAVMVSTAMQGGCTCENASLLRVGAGNVEIAGLFAPKPLGLTGADDWTVEMAAKGFPELRALYRMFGKENHVHFSPLNHFGHNYNYVSRTAMYRWMNRHLQLGLDEPILEEDYARLSADDLTVWKAPQHPKPDSGHAFERQLLRHWHTDSQQQVEKAAEDHSAFAAMAGPAIRAVVGRTIESAGDVAWVINQKNDQGNYLEMSGVLHNQTYGEVVPVIFLYPKEWSGASVLWLDVHGKAGLYDENGGLRPEVKIMLEEGTTVLGIDLLYQGESLAEGDVLTSTRRVSNPREAAAYTFGYNRSVFAQRVHDVVTTVQFLKHHDEQSKSIGLLALGGAGHWGAVARSVLGEAVDRYAVDTQGFRFHSVKDLHHPDFLPGGAKYLDLPGFLLLGADQPLWLAGEPTTSQQLLQRHNSQRGNASQVTLGVGGSRVGLVRAAVNWMIR